MLVFLTDMELVGQCRQPIGGLLLKLGLHIGKVYWDVTAVRIGQRFKNMADGNFYIAFGKKKLDAVYHLLRFWRKIQSY